jgi:uncharacterized membrane protein YfcA
MYEIISSVLSGGLIGFSLGLIGGGGSILATPLLLYFVGVSSPHIAIGTGALVVSLNAYANLISHALKGNVWWRSAIVFALIGTLGAFLGSTIGKSVDGHALLFLFGFVMVLVGALMLKPRKDLGGQLPPLNIATCILVAFVALLAGIASGFFGIGGGFLIVPALIFATKMPTITAVGSSLLSVGTFGLATSINYAIDGLVDWKIAGFMILGGFIGGILGSRLSNKIGKNKDILNRIFSILIFIVAAYVLYKSGNEVFS